MLRFFSVFALATFAVASTVCSSASAGIIPFTDTSLANIGNWSVGYHGNPTTLGVNRNTNPVPLTYVPGTVSSVATGIPLIWASPVAGTWINDFNCAICPDGTAAALSLPGWFKYSQEFELEVPDGFFATTSNFAFDVAGDNNFVVFLNGVELASVLTVQAFTPLTPVSYSGSLNEGLNVVDFYVFNEDPIDAPSPTGLLVTNVRGGLDSNVIPEPASFAIWAGVSGLGLLFRRRRKAAVVS
jgi:hypothetical protein